MTKQLPPLTALQFAVLESLGSNELKGQELRDSLRSYDIKKTPPAFYQLMSRLEQAKFVEAWYVNRTIGDQVVRERWYRVTGNGRVAMAENREFYRQHQTSEGGAVGLPEHA